MSLASPDFLSLGDLLDPTPADIARNAERARLHAEEVARVTALIAEREAHKALWASMSKEDKEEAMQDWEWSMMPEGEDYPED
jgi:hypothetical protein